LDPAAAAASPLLKTTNNEDDDRKNTMEQAWKAATAQAAKLDEIGIEVSSVGVIIYSV